jgi:zinc protease
MIKAALFWILTAVVTQVNAAEPSALKSHPPLYGAQFFKLENGLEVYLLENHRTPVVGIFIGYRVGGADDPIGKSGLAHYLEHMMFKGPKDSSASTITPFTENAGGQSNAMTSDDATIYYELIPREHANKVLSMEADRMNHLEILDNQAIPELKVILEERNMRIGNNPAGVFYTEVESVFFANHPYRNPVIGWEHEIKTYTPQDVKDLYRKAYGPNNAILMLTGDLTLKEAKTLVGKHFGKILPIKLDPRNRPQEPPFSAFKQIQVPSELVDTPTFLVRYPAPNFKKLTWPQVFALLILQDVLAGSENSLLYKHFVETQKLAAHVGSDYRWGAVDPHSFSISFSVSTGQKEELLEQEFKTFINNLMKVGVSDALVEKSKKRLLASFHLMRDSLLGGADDLLEALLNGIPLSEMENIPNHIQNVKASEVNKELKALFGKEFCLTALLYPKSKKASTGVPSTPITMPGPVQ